MPDFALWNAVSRCEGKTLRLALAHPAVNVHVTDADGNTLLHLAADNEEATGDEYREIIEALLNAGVDINARNKQGETFLLKMVQGCTAERVQSYLARGADPNIGDHHGLHPLDMALYGGEYERDMDTLVVLHGRN